MFISKYFLISKTKKKSETWTTHKVKMHRQLANYICKICMHYLQTHRDTDIPAESNPVNPVGERYSHSLPVLLLTSSTKPEVLTAPTPIAVHLFNFNSLALFLPLGVQLSLFSCLAVWSFWSHVRFAKLAPVVAATTTDLLYFNCSC